MLQNFASFLWKICSIREVGIWWDFEVLSVCSTVRCTLPLIGHMSAVKNLRAGTFQLNRKAARVWAGAEGVAAT